MLKVKEKVNIRKYFIVLAKPATNTSVYHYHVYSYPSVFAQSYCRNYPEHQMTKSLWTCTVSLYPKQPKV